MLELKISSKGSRKGMANLLDRNRPNTVATLTIAAVFSLLALPPALATDDKLIIPGQSVGQTHLGSNGNFYLNKLPVADASDTSTQHTRRVWIVKGHSQQTSTLFISTVTNSALNVQPIKGNTINHIEVTSPWFHTPDGIEVGSSRAQVLRHFPNARPVPSSGGKILSDTAKGIAFEFTNSNADSPCISIAVNAPGDSPAIVGRERVNDLLRTSSAGRKQDKNLLHTPFDGSLALSDLNETLINQSPQLKQEVQQALKEVKKDDVGCFAPLFRRPFDPLNNSRIAPFTCLFASNKSLTIEAKNVAKLPDGQTIPIGQLLARKTISQGVSLQFELTDWKWTNANQ